MAVDNWLPKPIDGKETGKMEAPLKAVDIRDTLNAYGGNVSNKTTSFFKPEANINRWSKHKPIVNSKLFLPFDDESWDNQTGTIPKVYMQSNLQHQEALAEVWAGCSEDDWFQYALPSGGTSEPLRLGDFRGYRADATSPFKSFSSDSTEIEPVNGTATFYLNMRYYLNDELAQADGGMLSLGDIALQNNDYDYYMLLVARFTPKNAIGGNTRYIAWKSNETIKEANWGELVSSINIGMINSTNEGTYEFAVGLTDNHSYHIKLPLPRITMTASIYYPTDHIFTPTASAYRNTSGTNDFVHVDCDYIAGATNEEPITITKTAYIGGSENMVNIILGYATLTLNPGERGTLKWRINRGNTYNFEQQIEPLLEGNDVVYINIDGGETIAVNVEGT